MERTRPTPAQLYAGVAGIVLAVVGILGFFVDTSFHAGSHVDGDTLLGFEVNGWHNIVHLASGLVGIAAAVRWRSARAFALAFGAVYAVVFVWGLFSDTVLWLVPVNNADNVLHAALAVLGLAAGLVSQGVGRGVDATGDLDLPDAGYRRA